MDNQKTTFSKQAFSVDDQINILQKRGLIIDDPIKTRHYLSTVSYYRLSGYFKPFQGKHDQNHTFKPGTSFENIWAIYVFDRELRLAMSDALERIEVALRTSLSNAMSLKYGNVWYLANEPFSKQWFEPRRRQNESPGDFFKREIRDICTRQGEKFIKHFYSKYSEPPYPPSWMLIECLSFGKCTSLFRNLGSMADKKAVCDIFGYHPKVIESCLEPLRYIRNLCAHHSRLWNRWFVYVPKHIKAFGLIETQPRSFHEQVFMIDKLHQVISPRSHWKSRLHDLFTQHEEYVPFSLMGFNDPWQDDPFWQS